MRCFRKIAAPDTGNFLVLSVRALHLRPRARHKSPSVLLSIRSSRYFLRTCIISLSRCARVITRLSSSAKPDSPDEDDVAIDRRDSLAITFSRLTVHSAVGRGPGRQIETVHRRLATDPESRIPRTILAEETRIRSLPTHVADTYIGITGGPFLSRRSR